MEMPDSDMQGSPLGALPYLGNSLQRACYQIRFLFEEKRALASGCEFREEDKDTDSEYMLASAKLVNSQIYEVLLLEHQTLMAQINTLLCSHAESAQYRLEVFSSDLYHIVAQGVPESVVSVDYFGIGTLDELQTSSQADDDVLIFLGERDFGELAPATPTMRGEFYRIVGDPFWGRLFWPFLIDLDATCFAINDPYSPILDVEVSEK